MNSFFRAPVTESSVVSKYEPEGRGVQSVSLLLRDTNRRLFALHVATAEEYLSSLRDDKDDPTYVEREPTYVVTNDAITTECLTEVLGHSELAKYLIAQDIVGDLGPY